MLCKATFADATQSPLSETKIRNAPLCPSLLLTVSRSEPVSDQMGVYLASHHQSDGHQYWTRWGKIKESATGSKCTRQNWHRVYENSTSTFEFVKNLIPSARGFVLYLQLWTPLIHNLQVATHQRQCHAPLPPLLGS